MNATLGVKLTVVDLFARRSITIGSAASLLLGALLGCGDRERPVNESETPGGVARGVAPASSPSTDRSVAVTPAAAGRGGQTKPTDSTPVVTFRRLSYDPGGRHAAPFPVAEFRVSNPGPDTLWYVSHTRSNPLVQVQERAAGRWQERPIGFVCGTGLEAWPLRPGTTLDVKLPLDEDEEAVKLGITLATRGGGGRIVSPTTYWSEGVEVAGRLPAPPTVVVPKSRRARQRALLHAARIGYERKVRALIEAGVDVNVRPSRPDGRTPRRYPGGGWARVESNWTPLHAAADHGHAGVVRLLIAAGADLAAGDGCGGTPLVYATNHGEHTADAALALIAAGADVNATLHLPDIPRGEDGLRETPLHSAAGGGVLRVVEALIAAGADVNARDGMGQAPLDLADEPSVADVLRKAGGRHADEASPAYH